jgi:hypothetical protein
MFPKVCFLLSLSYLMVVVAGQEDSREKYNDSMVLYEKFSSFEEDDIMVNENDHSNLRSRQLQALVPTQQVCRATNTTQRSVYACGGSSGGARDPCKNSKATCDSQPDYACMCTGSADTSCGYCQIRTANAILCQVTGSSTTFIAPDFGMRTCSCEYINGEVRQICYSPTPRPTSAPTRRQLPTPVPIQAASATPAPVLADIAPILVPPPVALATPPVAVQQQAGGCRARAPYNVYICIESGGTTSDFCELTPVSCGLLPSYSCSCSGSSTLCNYCEVRTANSVICQVTGNTMTFVAPDFSTKTCNCESVGTGGEVQQVCTSPTTTPVPVAVVPTPAGRTSNNLVAAGGDMP